MSWKVYNLAKKDIFRNTDFLSETPQYVYNDYEFYRLNFHAEFDSWYTMNAFNDAKNTIVMFGFFGDVKLNGEKIGELPVQSEWRDYLKTHFGEFYDFDL